MSTSTVLFDAPGPKGRRTGTIIGIVGVVAIVVATAALVWALRSQLLVADKWTPFLKATSWTEFIIPGLISTLRAAFFSIILAGVFGVVFGLGRLSQITAIRWICGVVVEFCRAVPVLVMMVFFYYMGLYQWQINGDILPEVAVVLGLAFYNGSVVAELIRSGVHGLPKGQSEAGLSIGLTRSQTLRAILLPQAVAAMLPSLLSQLVVVVKDTALGYIVTYPDLLRSLQTLASDNSNILAALILGAVIYILLNYLLTWLAGRIERWLRTRRGVRTLPTAAAVPQAVQPSGADQS